MSRTMVKTNNSENISTMGFFAKNAIKTGFSKEDELELIIQAQSGNKAAENKLVKAFTLYVMSLANNFYTKSLEPEDLVVAGQLGLVKAIRKFNTKTGGRLSTYARQWIEKEIYDEIYNNDQMIRIPQNVQAEKRSYEKFVESLPETWTDNEKESYACAFSGLSKKRIDNLKEAAFCNSSLDEVMGGDEDADTRMSFVSDTKLNTPEEDFEKNDLRSKLDYFKAHFLTEREAMVVDARAGWGYEAPLSLAETADLLGMAKSTVRDCEKRIAKKAHEEEALRLFEGYADSENGCYIA